jgi:hypothetical protein
LLQRQVFLLHDGAVRQSDIAEVPRLVHDAGNGRLILRITQNEAVFPGIVGQPFAFGRLTTDTPISLMLCSLCANISLAFVKRKEINLNFESTSL